MSQSDRAIKKFATQLARLDREVKSWRGAQADFTSIENGGNFTFKDGDGNVTAIMGGQDDGSNTIRHVDGPTPPVPSGLSAHVDGPIVQVSWDGTFEGDVTHDWHYLEVLAVGPSNEQLTGTINDLSGGETSLAATSQGDWFITARSVSRAGKRSLDGDAGTVAVQLVGLTGAIDAIQESANGKNTIYYSPTEPTPPELGFNNGDLWFDTSEEGNNTASVWDGAGWVSMEDARLAAIIAAQEALESDLQDVQTSVDGKNKITYDPALPPASYVGVVGDTWYRTSGNSMIGFWKWDGAAWVQQELSTTVIPQIDIGAGTFGSMDGSRLTAHSITSDRVIIGSGGNVVPWGQITAGATYSPHEPYAVTGSTAALTPADAAKGLPAHLTVTRTSAGSWASIMSFWATPGQKLPVDEGAEYVFTVRVYSSDVPRARLSLFAYSHGGSSTANNSGVFASSTGTQLSENVVEISVRGTVPVGAGYCLPYLQSSAAGPVGVVSVDLRKAVGTTLIENGAITTDKLAVGSITAESGIIESLDLGKATVGELDGIRIMGQTIRGEQLSGDAIDGKVITGGTYRTTDGTGQWSDAGLFIAQPDGTSMVRFPTDGSPLSLTASDVQIDRASVTDLDLSYGSVRSGGQVTLASGVTAPASPPELTTGWQKVASLQTPDSALTYDWLGLGYWPEGDGHWVRAVNVLGSEGDSYDRIEVYDATTGAFQKSISITLNPRAGVTVIGDIAYVLGPNHEVDSFYEKYVDGYSLVTGEKVSWFGLDRFTSASTEAKLAIGSDENDNIVIAGVTRNRELTVLRFDATTGAQVGVDWGTGTGVWTGGRDLEGVRVNGNEVTILPWRTARVYTASGNTLTRKLDSANANGFAGWDNPNRNGAGYVVRSELPHVVDSGAVYKGTQFSSDVTVQACFTWTDGTHESTPSPVASVTMPARNALTASLPIRSGLQKRVYLNAGGGWAWSDVPENVTTWVYPSSLGGFSDPPTVSTFPNADPAVLKSNAGGFEVKGDGSGHWGPLTFNSDGSMTGIPKMAAGKGETVTVTNHTDGFATKTVSFPAGRFTNPPAVTVSADSTAAALVNVNPLTITKDGFTLSVRRTNNTPTTVDWIAMEVS